MTICFKFAYEKICSEPSKDKKRDQNIENDKAQQTDLRRSWDGQLMERKCFREFDVF